MAAPTDPTPLVMLEGVEKMPVPMMRPILRNERNKCQYL